MSGQSAEVPTVKSPWLLQRCKALEFKDSLRTGEYLKLDYMGAAEFEFGAIPKFQREINAKLGTLEIFTCEYKGTTLSYLAAPDQEKAYAQVIRDAIDDKLRLKEYMGLRSREIDWQTKPKKRLQNDPKMPFQFDVWLDLCNALVIARRPQILKNLKRTIPNSIAYMDSQRCLGDCLIKCECGKPQYKCKGKCKKSKKKAGP